MDDTKNIEFSDATQQAIDEHVHFVLDQEGPALVESQEVDAVVDYIMTPALAGIIAADLHAGLEAIEAAMRNLTRADHEKITATMREWQRVYDDMILPARHIWAEVDGVTYVRHVTHGRRTWSWGAWEVA